MYIWNLSNLLDGVFWYLKDQSINRVSAKEHYSKKKRAKRCYTQPSDILNPQTPRNLRTKGGVLKTKSLICVQLRNLARLQILFDGPVENAESSSNFQDSIRCANWRKSGLNRIQVNDSERVDDKGEGGAVTFDVKRLE